MAMKINLRVLLLLTLDGIGVLSGSFSLNGIDYDYQEKIENPMSWYDAFRYCNSKGTFMVEYVSVDDWSNMKASLPDDYSLWIGLLLNEGKGWWAYGREYPDTNKFYKSTNWYGQNPFPWTQSKLKCTRTFESGSKLKWEMKDCANSYHALCQSKRYLEGEPFIVSVSSSYVFIRGVEDQAKAATDCESAGAQLATIRTATINQELYAHLQEYAGSSGQFYIGLKDVEGVMTWPDWSTVDSSLPEPSNADASSKKCVAINRDETFPNIWNRVDCNSALSYICMTSSDNSLPYRNQHYLFVEYRMDYVDANAECQDINGRLATVDDPGIQTFLEKIISSLASERWWIGLHADDGDWEWESRASYDFERFDSVNLSNEPDSDNDDCAAMEDDQWVAMRCTSNQAFFICELDDPFIVEVPTTALATMTQSNTHAATAATTFAVTTSASTSADATVVPLTTSDSIRSPASTTIDSSTSPTTATTNTAVTASVSTTADATVVPLTTSDSISSPASTTTDSSTSPTTAATTTAVTTSASTTADVTVVPLTTSDSISSPASTTIDSSTSPTHVATTIAATTSVSSIADATSTSAGTTSPDNTTTDSNTSPSSTTTIFAETTTVTTAVNETTIPPTIPTSATVSTATTANTSTPPNTSTIIPISVTTQAINVTSLLPSSLYQTNASITTSFETSAFPNITTNTTISATTQSSTATDEISEPPTTQANTTSSITTLTDSSASPTNAVNQSVSDTTLPATSASLVTQTSTEAPVTTSAGTNVPSTTPADNNTTTNNSLPMSTTQTTATSVDKNTTNAESTSAPALPANSTVQSTAVASTAQTSALSPPGNTSTTAYNASNFADQWIDIATALLLQNTESSNLVDAQNVTKWNSSRDGDNVNRIAFHFDYWISIKRISLLVDSSSNLKTFYLETSDDATINATSFDWTNHKWSFVPQRFYIHQPAGSHPEVKIFDIAFETITKTVVLVLDDRYEDAPVTINELKVFGGEIPDNQCLESYSNLTFASNASYTEVDTYAEVITQCFQSAFPCTGYLYHITTDKFRIYPKETEVSDATNQNTVYLNKCRDMNQLLIPVAQHVSEQLFFTPGTSIPSPWRLTRDQHTSHVPKWIRGYRTPNSRFNKHVEIRGCSLDARQFKRSFRRLVIGKCDQLGPGWSQVMRFFANSSPYPSSTQIFYQENNHSPYDGKITLNSSKISTDSSLVFSFHVDADSPIGGNFESLLMSTGLYVMNATSNEPEHGANEAREGNEWKGWIPTSSDVSPELEIDLIIPKRVAGVRVTRCSGSSYSGPFRVSYSTSSHPGHWDYFRSSTGNLIFRASENFTNIESQLFVFDKMTTARRVKFHFSSSSLPPHVTPCTKLELFGAFKRFDSEVNYATVTDIQLEYTTNTTNRNRHFQISLSTQTDSACFEISFGDGNREIYRRFENDCESKFASNATRVVDVTSNYTILVEHTFPLEGGVYNVTIQHCDGSMVSLFNGIIQVLVSPTIDPFSTLNNFYVDDDASNNVKVSVVGILDDLNVKACILISFDDIIGDVLVFRNVSFQLCADVFQNYSTNFHGMALPNDQHEIHVIHSYTKSGVFLIRAYYFDGIEVLQYSDARHNLSFISTFPQCQTNLKLTADKDDVITIYKSDPLTMTSYFTIDCVDKIASDLNITFEWTQLDCVTKTIVSTFPDYPSVSATFPPRTFKYGCHVIRVQSTVTDYHSPNVTSTTLFAEKNFTVVPAPLVANIWGGTTREASMNEDLIVDAERDSYDPDTGDNSELQFVFIYMLVDSGPYLELSNESVIERRPVSLQGNRMGVLRLSLPSYDVGSEVVATVLVSGSHNRRSQFTQSIRLVKENTLVAAIVCTKNCHNDAVNHDLETFFEIQFQNTADYLKEYEYSWTVSVVKNNTEEEMKLSLPDASFRQLTLPSRFLAPNTYFITQCNVTDKLTKAKSSLTSTFATDQLPFGGNCVATPSSGRALLTKFVCHCTGWRTDSQLPFPSVNTLDYSFHAVSSGGSVLLTHGMTEQSAPFVVFAGNEDANYVLEISVLICKRETFCSNTSVSIQVFPVLPDNNDETLEAIKLAGNNYDVSSLNQLANAIFSESTTNTSFAEAGVNEMRSSLIQSTCAYLDNIKRPTKYDIYQLTQVLKASTSSLQNVSNEVMRNGANALEKLGSELLQLVETDERSLSSDDVTGPAANLVSVINSFLQAVKADTSKQEIILLWTQFEQFRPQANEISDLSPREIWYLAIKDAKTEKIHHESSIEIRRDLINLVVQGSSHVTQSMVQSNLAPYETPAVVSNGDVELAAITVDYHGNDVRVTSRWGDSVRLEGGRVTKLEIAFLQQNPFKFSESSILINSGVPIVTLEGSSDYDDDLRNLQVSLDNKNTSQSISVSMISGSITTSRFEVTSLDTSIMTYLIPEERGSKVKVWIRWKTEPLLERYSSNPDITGDVSDYTFELPLPGLNESDDEAFKVFIDQDELLGTGIYFLSAEINGTFSNRRKRDTINNTTRRLDISIQTLSCKVYDETSEEWETGECKADLSSSLSATLCNCKVKPTSTTIVAAQFFPAPNTIDFSTVFAKVDVINNGTVLWTVVGLIVFLGLLLLWTRRADKKDEEKWSTKLMSDNLSTDSYYYKITFITGIGSASGTTSNVFFSIAGDSSKTTTREARDSSKRHWFKHGSVVHFLMSVPSSLGDLEYIRVWHDSSGQGASAASWYLSDVVVQDLHTDKMYIFPCEKWLALDLDDGKIDRILPVAGDDNLSSFRRIFKNTAKQKLTDGHLWFSVFVNRSRSPFTRCQRIACGAAALFLTMIANAMFYKSDDEAQQREESFRLQIGPIAIDPNIIGISLVSMFIVIPPSILLIQIFTRTDHLKRNKVEAQMSLPTVRSEPLEIEKEKQGVRLLPYWFAYIGWIIAFVAIITSSFFIVLYSFQWGKEKSEKWLSAVLLSFAEDVALLQPVKVVVSAVLLALLCRKATNYEDEWKRDEEVIVTAPASPSVMFHDNVSEDSFEPDAEPESRSVKLHVSDVIDELSKLPSALETEDLAKTRNRMKIERRAVKFTVSFLSYIFYISLLLFIAYRRHQDNQFYHTKSQLRHIFGADDFEEVQSMSDLWEYLESTYIPAVYPVLKYNGKEMHWRDRIFMEDSVNYRVGPTRMRLLRSTPGPCDAEVIESSANQSEPRQCHSSYVIFNEDTNNYTTSWQAIRSEKVTNEDSWTYSSSTSTKAIPILGKIGLYGGGGYVADLGGFRESASKKVAYLKDKLWLDRATRFLIIELTIYNANSKLFALVHLLTEFKISGGILSTVVIEPFKLYGFTDSLLVFGSVVLAGVFALWHAALTCWTLVKRKRKFFRSSWNLLAMVRIPLILSYVIASVYGYSLQDETLKQFQRHTYLFTNFQSLAWLLSAIRDLSAIIIFIESVRLLYFLRYHKHMRRLSKTFLAGKTVLLSAMLHFLLCVIGYALLAIILFSQYMPDFQTFDRSLQALFAIVLGHPLYTGMQQAQGIFGEIFFLCFGIHMTSLLFNLLISTLEALHGSSKGMLQNSDRAKQNYFHITLRVFCNFFRRRINRPVLSTDDLFECGEKKRNGATPTTATVDEEPRTGEFSNSSKRLRKHRKAEKKRKRSRSAILLKTLQKQDTFEEKQLNVLLKLNRLEEMIDSIDVTLTESVAREAERKNITDSFLGQADVIIDGILDDLSL